MKPSEVAYRIPFGPTIIFSSESESRLRVFLTTFWIYPIMVISWWADALARKRKP